MTNENLFEVLGNMLANLKDGHVDLISANDVARYWKWFEDYPENFDDSIHVNIWETIIRRQVVWNIAYLTTI